MVNAVVFDLNGVFLKSELLTKRIEEHFNIPADESLLVLKESLKEGRLNPNAKIFEYWESLFKRHDIEITEEEFFSFWFRGETLVPELIEVTKNLRDAGVKVYIFSNNFRERTEYYRKNFKEIFENVEKAFFSWETGFVKPSKESFENLLDVINIDPSEIIYFDDSQENIEVARSFGIQGYIYEDVDETMNIFKKEGILI